MNLRRNTRSLFNTGPSLVAALLCVAVLAWAGAAGAQLPIGPSTQFDITGFIQEATLDAACATDAHCGGTIKVNGHVVTVPKETIVIFPANALSWQELFVGAPLPWGTLGTAVNTAPLGGPTSGLAMADCAVGAAGACTAGPLTTWEAEVVGNRVGDTYIAGLIYVSQQGLNSGAGFINSINYTTGEMLVGGPIGSLTLGARVRINDPAGRYTNPPVAGSTDLRFTVDPDNPTITAGTGYPMCLPRVAPDGDPLCPQGNRPLDVNGNPSTKIVMNNLTNPAFQQIIGGPQDSTKQAPFEVGDYITFAGTLVKDAPAGGVFAAGDGPTVGPLPATGTAGTYISAHTIVGNVSILTWPGSNPAYVETDVTIIGTGGLIVLGAGEAAIRTRFEGMMTDPSREVHLYGMDLDKTGAEADRDWGTIGVDPGPPTGAVTGRWRFRPPCAVFGTVPAKPDKQCVMNASGTFLPPTREVRAVIVDAANLTAAANPTLSTSVNVTIAGVTTTITNVANGLIWGQFHAPILTYVFPENVPGAPMVENNFNALQFLACGGYTSSLGTVAGVLNPWPSNILPDPTACPVINTLPVISAVSATPNPIVVGPGVAGATGTLSVTATSPNGSALTYLWTQAATDAAQVTFGTPTAATTTVTLPAVLANTTLNFTVQVTNSSGSVSAPLAVSVLVDAPAVNHVPPVTVTSGQTATLNITGTDPAGLPLTFAVTVTPTPSGGTTLTQVPPSGATFTLTHTIPTGGTQVIFNVTIVATNTAGVSSAPEFTTITVNPTQHLITITSAEYRTGKQRLIINASDALISAAVVMTLQPYVCEADAAPCKLVTAGQPWQYFPSTAAGGSGDTFTNNGGGLYILDISGAPRPACNRTGTYATPCSFSPIQAKDNSGGISPFSALTRIRQ
jgi:hypothetical protein